ncbi:hypothetical protein KP509_30G068700 [Ceratopteris richardii]|uniref:Amine oxidase domain-containing protein n=1 Tax=Ceratopteris richardii TaxID=49495 RepID=A0A8T2R5S4_CERRI|nr:hypothetical protein KP509_30G068700 [Ceratopteris richardii]
MNLSVQTCCHPQLVQEAVPVHVPQVALSVRCHDTATRARRLLSCRFLPVQEALSGKSKRSDFLRHAAIRATETAVEDTTGASPLASNGKEDWSSETGVIVVGAGLAGLAAARHLTAAGEPFLLVEASDGVGGRVRTDEFEGFLLDRGFQIFITAYPEAQRILDYDGLKLRSFYAGALVWFNGGFHKVADPLRHLTDGLLSLVNPIGNVFDKTLVGLVRLQAAIRADTEILTSTETTIMQRLSSTGFSPPMVDRFFRPFFGGIFFDNQLQTTSRLFDFVFKCLALGSNTLPERGIGAIPLQIAEKLPQSSILLESRVVELMFDNDRHPVGVKLEDGRLLKCNHGIILAVEGPEASRLLGNQLQVTRAISRPPRSTVCLYFSTDKSPIKEPILLLNGSGKGVVNNMFFPTTVSKSYSPPGQVLVSVSLVGLYEEKTDEELEEVVRAELADWFSKEIVATWKHLRTYRIKLAQPDQTPPTDLLKEPRVSAGIYVCGDHRDSSTFDGAFVSGRRAADAILRDVKAASV